MLPICVLFIAMTSLLRFSFLFGLCLAFSYSSMAQEENLVPNSSFEQYRGLPSDVAQGRKCIAQWKFPNFKGSGEYYHSDCKNRKVGTRRNKFGSQLAHSGSAYMGICIAKAFREYLQTELKQTLIKGEKYRISIFISCADKIGLSHVKEFNLVFSQKPFLIPTNEILLIPPTIRFTGDFKNKSEWIELSTNYEAKGTEKFLTFGSFPYTENGQSQGKIYGITKYAHYYVDDISITKISNEETIVLDLVDEEISLVETIKSFSLGETYVFKNLLFESGKSVLLINDYSEVEKLIAFLKNKMEYSLLISGHTDNVGDSKANQSLSYQRADAVRSFLIKRGISKGSIQIEGKGDTRPIRSNATEEGREQNRRVEISIIN